MFRKNAAWRKKIEQYGKLGIIVYLSIFTLSLLGSAALLKMGLADKIPWIADNPKIGTSATFVGAYLLTKAIQIPRLLLTLAITPAIARWTGQPVAPITPETAPVAPAE